MRRIAMILLSMFFLVSACKKEHFDIHNLNNNVIAVVGHGGMGINNAYPINSFESVQYALALGSDGVEIDVQMTKDSVLVAFHQERLEDATDASGRVYNKTWDEIKDTRYKDPLYSHYRLVSLDELFSHLYRSSQQRIFLDCKNFKPDTSEAYVNTFTNALILLIDKHDLHKDVVVELKRENMAASLKNRRPDIQQFIYTKFDMAMDICERLHLEGIVSDVNEISKDEVWIAHQKGVMVAVFNAHSKKTNRDAIEKNVDVIQTDRLKYLIRLLK